ncbi:TAF1A [Cervus elaphus hippelaphus]|uniref:TAF1A n=1 Tax=Cervus elaphus hippelaphus TaxID=46360 RepID=A0A212CRE3_CEREH|nr:TAF1A [Cervus elaphus hippelaphus]
MLNRSWKTSVNLCALIQIPGVWDPFVKSYVEMLEFYGDRDGAREVLNNYAYDEKFPSNPNAHVYLYNFLKREKAPREKLISVLKESSCLGSRRVELQEKLVAKLSLQLLLGKKELEG